jgi:hypothetical protein
LGQKVEEDIRVQRLRKVALETGPTRAPKIFIAPVGADGNETGMFHAPVLPQPGREFPTVQATGQANVAQDNLR